MSFPARFAAAALFGLALASSALAQVQPPRVLYPPNPLSRPGIVPFPVNPNQYVAPNVTARQLAFNVATLGQAYQQVPPYLLGYNPYPSPVISSGPVVANAGYGGMANPYALSTVASTNPYMSSAALGTSPYSLSTSPTGGGSGYTPYYAPGAGYSYQDPYGSALQGLASVTSATGQYHVNIQKARLLREQSRQAAIDTARKRLEFEAWYETVRPTAPRMLDAERATDLDRARKGAPATEVWSGKALNDLLASVQKAKAADPKNLGPNVPLEDSTLKHLNLTGQTGGAGNAGLLRKLLDKDYRLNWPEALADAGYEKLTKDLESEMRAAALDIYQGNDLATDKKKNIRSRFEEITKKFNESADELSPSQ